MIDNPRDLVWRGRSNLYARIGVFQTFSGAGERQEPIVDFSRWMETPTDRRESGSKMVTTSVWDAADPLLALASRNGQPDSRLPVESGGRPGKRCRRTPGSVRIDSHEPPTSPCASGRKATSRSRPPRAAPRALRRIESGANPSALERARRPRRPLPCHSRRSTNPALGPVDDDPLDLPTDAARCRRRRRLPPRPPPRDPRPAPKSSIVAARATAPRRAGLGPTREATDPSQPARDRRSPLAADQEIVRNSDQLLATLPRLRSRGRCDSGSPPVPSSSFRRP